MAVVVVLNDMPLLEPNLDYFFITPRETLPHKFRLINLLPRKHHASLRLSGQCSVPLSLHRLSPLLNIYIKGFYNLFLCSVNIN